MNASNFNFTFKIFLDTRKCVNNKNRFCCVKNTLNIFSNVAYVK